MHNLLLQLFTVKGSKIEDETFLFHTVISEKDHPRYVKHVVGRIYVFSTQFRYWVRGGIRGFQGIGTQSA